MTLVWLPLAVLSYLMQAVNGAVDRIIVHKEVTKPVVISFWVAIFSIFTLGLPLVGLLPAGFAEPFHFEAPTPGIFLLVILSGAMTQIGLFYMYTALEEGEATRVLSVIGAATPVIALVVSFFVLGERINGLQLAAFVLLVIGAFVLTFKLNVKAFKYGGRWLNFTLLAAAFLAVQTVVAKVVFNNYHFISAFSLMGLGALFYALALVAFSPRVRAALFNNQQGGKTGNTRSQVWLIIANSALGGIAVIILNYALSLGSPSFINALRGVQYAGVFVIALLLAKKHPVLLDEELTRRSIIQKISGIVLIVNGVVLLAL